mgnify:CR=1 FL=1
MSDPRRPTFDWTLWIQWLAATTVGWLLGGVLLPELALVAAGLVIGIMQWVILRQRLAQAGWWILASALGWTAGWAVLITLIPPEYGAITGPVLGAAMGALQWLFLRQQLYRAGWWVLVSALAWTVAFSGIMGQFLIGAVAGAVTGIALELLLRYPGLMKAG